MHPPLLVEARGGVTVCTLDRPEQRNAFTIDLYRALTDALRAADADPGVGAVVLTGSGPAFCAGTDLGELAAIAAGNPPEGSAGAFPGLLAALLEITVPLVAAVNGAGVGLGFTLLPYCDIVVMADTARLRTPFAEMGVPPEAGSSYLLPARMGWPRAARALLAGEWLSATDAVTSGIATESCPADEVLPRALDTAQRIAAMPAGSARRIKRLMRAAERDAVAAARAREDRAYQALYGRDPATGVGEDRPQEEAR